MSQRDKPFQVWAMESETSVMGYFWSGHNTKEEAKKAIEEYEAQDVGPFDQDHMINGCFKVMTKKQPAAIT